MGIFRRRPDSGGTPRDPDPARRAAGGDPAGLVEEGIRLTGAGNLGAAERVLSRAAEMLADAESVPARRLLVKARWRLSLVVHAAGRPAAALPTGRAGVEVGRALLAEVPAPDAAAVTAEVATAAVDLAEAAFAAGRAAEAFALLDEAVAWTGRGSEADRDVRRVYGTALHNRATGLLDRAVARALSGDTLGRDLEQALRAATEAVRARERLRLDSDLLSVWELANTRLLQVRVALLAGQLPLAVDSLSEATGLLPPLGAAGIPLGAQARQLAAALESEAPAEVARRHRTGPWPS